MVLALESNHSNDPDPRGIVTDLKDTGNQSELHELHSMVPLPTEGQIRDDDEKQLKTSDLYHTVNVPWRFEHPGTWNYGNPVFTCINDILGNYGRKPDLPGPASWVKGWPHRRVHPLFKTTSMDYGSLPPSIHTMPITYFPVFTKFSEHLINCGMYRNRSLNTGIDKHKVLRF